jgi:hypothetical protein
MLLHLFRSSSRSCLMVAAPVKVQYTAIYRREIHNIVCLYIYIYMCVCVCACVRARALAYAFLLTYLQTVSFSPYSIWILNLDSLSTTLSHIKN